MYPVVLLAGGLATRLKPITEKVPKSMLDVAGKPFISHQLELLNSKGVGHVVMCVGHLGEMIEDKIKDGKEFGLKVAFSYDGDKLLGTGGAIKKAEAKLPEAFFVMYGDSYLDIDYLEVQEAYMASGKDGLMTVYRNDGKWDASNVIFTNGNLVKYSKRHRSGGMDYIDYGLGILSKKALENYEQGTVFDLADVYERLSEEGQLHGHEVFNRFYEIGSKEGLEEVVKLLEPGRA